jgi:hypothetical protein
LRLGKAAKAAASNSAPRGNARSVSSRRNSAVGTADDARVTSNAPSRWAGHQDAADEFARTDPAHRLGRPAPIAEQAGIAT